MKHKKKKKYLLAMSAVMTISATAGLVVENPTTVDAAELKVTYDISGCFDGKDTNEVTVNINILANETGGTIYVKDKMLVVENPKQTGMFMLDIEITDKDGEMTRSMFVDLLTTIPVIEDIEEDGSNEGTITDADGDKNDVGQGQDGKVTLELMQGEFTLNTSDVTSFGTVKLTAAKQTVTTDFAQNFGVVDARGTQEGWNVTVSATPFTVETFDGFVGTPHQLPVGSLALNSVTGIERLNHANTVDGLPTGLINGLTTIDTNNALSILHANQGEGLGEFKFNFGTDALALTVDARTAKIDTVNYPKGNTPYASTVTWDLISGPQQ